MIGSKQLIIDASDFIKGMSTSDDISDGGFSNLTTAVNLTAVPGVLYAPATTVNKSTGMVGNVMDSASDITGTNSRMLVSVSGTGTGEYFTYDTGGTLTSRQTDAATTYTSTTQMIAYQTDYFVATNTEIVKLTGSTLGTIDKVWWTTTKGKGALTTGVRHPMIVFEGSLWIGDLNGLHKWDGTTATEDFLLLNSSETIVALGVDPSTGRMLISTTGGANASNTFPYINKVYAWDGVATTLPGRAVIVDDMVTAMYSLGGITYMTYGLNFGYWNGSGITFLRKFKNVTLAVADLAYKRAITHVGNTLYIVDGKQILAYGEVLPGRKVFYYAQDNTISAAKYTHIAHLGSGVLGLFFATAKFYTHDTSSVATADSISFITNKYLFPRPVYLRSIRLEYGDGGVANGGSIGDLKYRSSEEAANVITLSTTVNSSGGTVYFTNNLIGFSINKVNWVQFQLDTFTQLRRLRRLILYIDPAE